MIALDTETTLITDEAPVPQLVSVSAFNGGWDVLLAAHDPHARDAVASMFEHGVVCANAPFDVFVLLRQWPDLEPAVIDAYQHGRVRDVQTREKLLDIAHGAHQRGYSLAALCERRLGVELPKDEATWRKRYGELLGVPISDWPEAAKRYARDDALWTFRVWADQEEHGELLSNEAEQARKHLALYAQSLRGIPTDQERVRALAASLNKRLADEGHTLALLGLARWEGKKHKRLRQDTKAARHLMADFCEQHGQQTPMTATGQIGLSEDDMRAVGVPPGHPLTIYRERKGLGSQLTRLIPVLEHPIVRTRYDLADTGRSRSSAPGEPWHGSNFQNLPTSGGYRECLMPPPGERFVISDWGGAELVTLGQIQLDVLGHSTLAEILRAGRNPHTEFACRLMDTPIDKYDPENPQHVKIRRVAKEWNFGRSGGMGDSTFQVRLRRVEIEMSLEEIKRNNAIWHETLPEMRLYFDWIKQHPSTVRVLDDGRQIELYTIRQLRSNRIRGGCTFTEAANTMFQGLAADAAGTALWWLWLDGRDPGSPLYAGEHTTSQVLFVHDENVSSVPAARAEAALVRQEQIMIAAFAHWCPDVPITVESRITESYCK